MQHAVVIIKPHAVQHRLALLQRLKNVGFRIIGERVVDVNVDEAWFICKHDAGLTNVANAQTEAAVHSLLGTAVTLLLNHKDAFQVLQDIAGPEDPGQARSLQPKTLRALYGEQGSFNAVSFTDTPEKAIKSIQHFFPRYSDLLHGPAGNVSEERVQIDQYFRTRMLPTLLDAFYDMCVVKPSQPVTYLANFLLNNNPNRPKVLRPSDIRTQRGRSGFTSTSDYREQTKGQSAHTTTEGFLSGESKDVSTADFEREMRRSGYTNTEDQRAPAKSAYASTGDFYRESRRSGQTSMGGKEEGPTVDTMTDETPRRSGQTSMGGKEEGPTAHTMTDETPRRSGQTSMGGKEESPSTHTMTDNSYGINYSI